MAGEHGEHESARRGRGSARDTGAWIFVSHSHSDLTKVRRVRDELEALGHNPLLFFLKCLGDDDEIDSLIRREIEARTWFVLCDSANARTSRWVQSEVEIIKDLAGKVYEVIDLDGDIEEQLDRIARLARQATVFMSYADADRPLAEQLKVTLRALDYAVWDARTDLAAGESWEQAIRVAVDRAMRNGAYMVLISPDSLRSPWLLRELESALELERQEGRGKVRPVLVRGVTAEDLPGNLRHLDFTVLNSDGSLSG